MLGLEGLRTDKGLSARWGERKVAVAEAQRQRLLKSELSICIFAHVGIK